MEETKEQTEISQVMKALQERIDVRGLAQQFQRQDEFVHIPSFFPPELISSLFLPDVKECEPFIHRSYIPLHKASGSVSSTILSQHAPKIDALYHSQALQSLLCHLTNQRLFECPATDLHALALYFYTQEGDHIGYHYDSSFYQGKRYTVLLGLIDNQSTCKLVCSLFTKTKTQPVQNLELAVNPGDLIVFNGDRLWHAVTPLKGGTRVVLSMEFVSTQQISHVGKFISNVKDAVAYFGISSLFSYYLGLTSRRIGDRKHARDKRLVQQYQIEMSSSASVTHFPHLIAFVNINSGGRQGKVVLPLLQKLLGQENVFDLVAQAGPEQGLLRHQSTANLRVIACGGDGTIRWVIQGLIKIGFQPLPPIGIIPLGTGNDLSRTFGWGSGYTYSQDLSSYVSGFLKAATKPMDLWNCSIAQWDPQTQQVDELKRQDQIMFNYFNLGFDPLAAYGFHTQRLVRPHLFSSRFVNKCWYIFYALNSIVSGSPYIKDTCRIWADDQELSIPSGIRTVVVLNFLCYQAGTDLWGPDSHGNVPKFDDQLIEVVGIQGLFHEALLRVNLTSGVRLGRGSSVKIVVTKPNAQFAMAWDGEPMLSQPFTCEIKHSQQIEVLVNPDQK